MSFEGRLSVSKSHPFLIEAEELLYDHTSHLIIDTRSEEHYAAGHIPSAIHFCTYDQFVRSTSPIGLSRFQRSMAETYSKIGVDPHKPVVVYEEKTGMRAARDCWMLQYMGHPNVRILHGGLEAWRQKNGALDTEPISLDSTIFDCIARDDIIISARDILGHLATPTTTVLDVRTYEDLRRILQEHHIATEHPVITYCHRGARSAVAYYALKMAGCHEVRNYIGSWHEWAIRNDLPIESGK